MTYKDYYIIFKIMLTIVNKNIMLYITIGEKNMRKLTRKQWQTLRMNYDSNTVWQIEQNIIEIVNKYSKDHNLKGFWKTMFIREIKYAFVNFYDLMPRKSNNFQLILNNALRILRKYNIVPYDNVMSCKYNILSKFGNAYISA